MPKLYEVPFNIIHIIKLIFFLRKAYYVKDYYVLIEVVLSSRVGIRIKAMGYRHVS